MRGESDGYVDRGERRSFSEGIGECVGSMDWFEDLCTVSLTVKVGRVGRTAC